MSILLCELQSTMPVGNPLRFMLMFIHSVSDMVNQPTPL